MCKSSCVSGFRMSAAANRSLVHSGGKHGAIERHHSIRKLCGLLGKDFHVSARKCWASHDSRLHHRYSPSHLFPCTSITPLEQYIAPHEPCMQTGICMCVLFLQELFSMAPSSSKFCTTANGNLPSLLASRRQSQPKRSDGS